MQNKVFKQYLGLVINVLVASLFFVFSISAQEQDFAEKDGVTLVNEFNNVNSETLSVYVEHLRNELQKTVGSNAYIVTYRGEKTPLGFPIRNGVRIKNYLVRNLGVAPERIEFFEGGLTDKQLTRFYVAQPNSTLRSSFSSNLNSSVENNSTVLFDDFLYPSRFDGEGCCAIDSYTNEQKQASINAFAKILQENPNLNAYLIVYGQYCADCSSSAVWSRSGKYLGLKPDIYLDSQREIATILTTEKTKLAKDHNIKLTRIRAINGGYRQWRSIQLYLAPENGKLPQLKPTTFPPKTKRTTKTKARNK